MGLSRTRSSGPAASCHMLSSVDCITTTSESEFLVHTTAAVASNAQCEHFNHTNSNHEHRERYGIIMWPIPLLMHDTPPCSRNSSVGPADKLVQVCHTDFLRIMRPDPVT